MVSQKKNIYIYSTQSIRNTNHIIRQETEIKEICIVKEELKLSFFTDDMVLHIEDPKISTKNLLQLIISFSNVEK